MGADVTVAIPVHNGERYLSEVLSAVRAQDVAGEVEILAVDSESTDRSMEIAEEFGARIHRIRKADFSHGGTRNLAMELAEGEHVAFLTQDATPASDRWLSSMLEGFAQADDVALVFGPHLPRPDASHMIKAEMAQHFRTWGDGERIDLQRLDRTAAGLRAYRGFPGRFTFFSDVNGAVAKWAWRTIPYRRVPYSEDQLLGREMIEAGFAKVYHPGFAVLHSHDYPPATFFRRYFDEFRSLREVLGHREALGWRATPLAVYGRTKADWRWLREQRTPPAETALALTSSIRHHTLRQTGAVLGSRADRLRPRLRAGLSLDGRSTFERYEVPASPLLKTEHEVDARPVRQGDWPWEFVRRAYPMRRVSTMPHAGSAAGPWTLAWVIPPWSIGSGGHTTIFRLIRQLETRGHRSVIHVFDPHGRERRRNPAVLRDEIRERFIPIDAQVFYGLDDFAGADVAVATEWSTAYPVRDLPGCREKVYLVQDIEPEFYATSAQGLWAEQTYRMGYRCIAYTPWMANILRERYDAEAQWFECGTDLDVFPFAGPAGREPGLIAVYARRETERRAVDLALAALGTLAERRPDVHPVLFGSRQSFTLPFPADDLGVVPPARLAGLYQKASVGLVFSLTTHSLVAHEMMASGLPVVELEGANVGSALGESGDLAVLADKRPDSIADAIAWLLDDPSGAAAMAQRARRFVEDRTWERAGDQVESALATYLASPRPQP